MPASDVPGEQHGADAADSGQAAAARARELHSRRSRDGRRHHRGARGVLPRVARSQRRLAELAGRSRRIGIARRATRRARRSCSRARSAARAGAASRPIRARARVRQHEQRGRHRLARAKHRGCDVRADRRGRAHRASAVSAHERRRRAAGALLVRTTRLPTPPATSRAAARRPGRARSRRGASSWPSTLQRATIVWRVPLGITEQLPESRRRTGRLNLGGPIVTAAGLVFIGASNDRRFRAFDSRTGAELWVTELPLSAHAVPITYRGGRRPAVRRDRRGRAGSR